MLDSVSPVKADGWLGASSGYIPGNDNTAQDDDPSHPIAAYFAMLPAWKTMRSCLEGNQYLKQITREHIPILPNESDDCYRRRVNQALFTPYTSRVIDSAISLILRKPITLEGGNEQFWEEFRADVDRQGSNLQDFARKVLVSSIGYGHAGMMVDYPKATGIRTLADERKAKLMPYLTMIEPFQFLGWRQDRRKSGSRLDQVRIREVTTQPRGMFGEEQVEQVRVLENGKFQVYQRTQADAQWVMVEAGRTSLKEIPLAITYSEKKATLLSEPPLLDVAHINLAHYRLQSQHLNALNVAGFPLLVLKGWDDQSPKLQVDVSKAVAMPIDGDISYVEPSNAAFQAYMDELDALANQCSNLGISVLAQQKMVAEAAKKAQLDRADSNSMLANISLDFEQALQQAINMAAEYAGQEAPTVGLSRDFDAQTLDGSGITAINSMFTSGLIDQETALELLHQGEILKDDIDLEEILSRSENEALESMEMEIEKTDKMMSVSDKHESADPKKDKPPVKNG